MSKENSFIKQLEAHAREDFAQEMMFLPHSYPPEFADQRISRPVIGLGDMTDFPYEIKMVRLLSPDELSGPPGKNTG